jgi:hypothetical protein
MAEENKGEHQARGAGDSPTSEDGPSQSGDPGRTPGTAEGDRETVEEDLRDKEGDQHSA